jgi:hypothetical protein
MARGLVDGQVGESDEGFEANQMSLGMLVPLLMEAHRAAAEANGDQ